MLNRFLILCLASLMSLGGATAMAAPVPAASAVPPTDAQIIFVRAGGGGAHMGGGVHMGGGGPHFRGGGPRLGGAFDRGVPMHQGGFRHGHWAGDLFIWGYDPGWYDCYYSNSYHGWVCPDD